MSLALETVCGKFGMELTDEPATRVIASKIIELAQSGVRDAPTITEMKRLARAWDNLADEREARLLKQIEAGL
jgi:hypothetical protein